MVGEIEEGARDAAVRERAIGVGDKGMPSATSVFAKRCGVTITSVRTAGTFSDEPSAVRTLTQPLKS